MALGSLVVKSFSQLCASRDWGAARAALVALAPVTQGPIVPAAERAVRRGAMNPQVQVVVVGSESPGRLSSASAARYSRALTSSMLALSWPQEGAQPACGLNMYRTSGCQGPTAALAPALEVDDGYRSARV